MSFPQVFFLSVLCIFLQSYNHIIICYFGLQQQQQKKKIQALNPKMSCAKTSSKLREENPRKIIITEKACLQF